MSRTIRDGGRGGRRGVAIGLAAAGLTIGQYSFGQMVAPGSVQVSGDVPGVTTGTDVPDWVKKLAIDPQSSQAQKYAAQQKVRVAAEKQLKKIRAKHFGTMKNLQVRQ